MSSQAETKHNIAILPKSGCYGCGVCVNVCPTDCISFENDHEGFPYPTVDQEACIDCQKCIRCCPGLNDLNRERFSDPASYYAGYNLDEVVRRNSSSGGFFSLVADEILAQGGVVYGARYDFDQMTVVHARVETQATLASLRKSKYVQSSSVHIFPQVKKDLAGKQVLFTGTPCQVAGLHLYLKESHANLVTCDNICHGVPSPGLFQRHFSALAEKHKKPITQIDFRTKTKGWKGPLELFLQVDFAGESTLTYAALDAYYALFLANLSLRPCCYECKYASTQRVSDLTLGDFWGVNKHHPELFDSLGTSLILVNTKKGGQLLQALDTQARIEPVREVRPFPPNLAHPTPKPKYRDRFFTHVNMAEWHPGRWWIHFRALAIIARDKLWGMMKKLISNF
jgi:NAD-dependent dihydropyrimidine dehydrogenase PreA subunit